MADYGDIIRRLMLKTDNNEDVNDLMDEVSKLKKKELFILLKSMAIVIASQQKELSDLKPKSAKKPRKSKPNN
jgi:hypothetical protein